MFNNKTKMFLLLTLVFITVLGVSAVSAADIDSNATDASNTIASVATQESSSYDASDNIQSDVTNNNKQITKNNLIGDESDTSDARSVKTAPTEIVFNESEWSTYFNDDGSLKDSVSEYDTLKFAGEFNNKSMVIDKEITITTADIPAVLYNSSFTIMADNVLVTNITMTENEIDAITFVSDGNVLNNSIININSEDLIHAIWVEGNNNTIVNTVVNVTAPSGDVEYNPDFSTKTPAPAAIVVASDDNVLDNVDVYFNGTEKTGYFPTVNGIYIVSTGETINGNILNNSRVAVIGSNYVYGVNVGNAKNTKIENIEVDVNSEYYADAIQLFDAETISITGNIVSEATAEVYGVYSTAMGVGYSRDIDLTGLNIEASARKATGVLLEGASDVIIADSEYYVQGESASAVDVYVDWMGNEPNNITISNLNAYTDAQRGTILYFGQSSDITIDDCVLTSTNASGIVFNNATNAVLSNSEIYNATITTYLISDVIVNSTVLSNVNTPAIYFESEGNIVYDTEITVVSDEPLHAVELVGDLNTIVETNIYAKIPSADVVYDQDYVGSPASSALYISSSNNIIDEVTVVVDGRSAAEGQYFPSIDAVDIQSPNKNITLENNTLANSTVIATGVNYVYGVNVGRAKNTELADNNVYAYSAYYADAIQLFDAEDTTINGQVVVEADSEGYGVYSTAMGMGDSRGIDLTGLDVSVRAPKATGVLLEGSSDAIIADADYAIRGDNAAAIKAYIDWMGNVPTNIEITGLKIDIEGTGEDSVLYFGACDNVTITENTIESTRGSEILFNSTTNSQVTDNYIKIYDTIYGDYAVISTTEDTIVENNTPVNKVTEDLQAQIDDLQAQIDDLQKQLDDLTKTTVISIDDLGEATVGEAITISGRLTCNGQALAGKKVAFRVGDTKIRVYTDDEGYYNVSYTPTDAGTFKFAVAYAGNDDYYMCSNKSTMVVNNATETKKTVISIDDLGEAKVGEAITISGKLTCNGQALAGKKVAFRVGDTKIKVYTDGEGYYSVIYTPTDAGTFKFAVAYAGDDEYAMCSNKSTMVVNNATETKKATVIYTDSISEAKVGEAITISGRLLSDGQALAGKKVAFRVGDTKIKVRTNDEGYYNVSYTPTAAGTFKFAVAYAGNDEYYMCSSKSTMVVK